MQTLSYIILRLYKPVQIGEIQKEIRTWARDAFNIAFYPTRYLSTQAMCVVKSDRNAIHISHDGSQLIGYEEYREEGVGDGYIFTQAFDTTLLPYEEDATTNYYNCLINTVTS